MSASPKPEAVHVTFPQLLWFIAAEQFKRILVEPQKLPRNLSSMLVLFHAAHKNISSRKHWHGQIPGCLLRAPQKNFHQQEISSDYSIQQHKCKPELENIRMSFFPVFRGWQ